MAMVDLPLYHCRGCKNIWVGDDRLLTEPDRCPKCGRYAGEGNTEKGDTSNGSEE
jgi:hypothetical protein